MQVLGFFGTPCITLTTWYVKMRTHVNQKYVNYIAKANLLLTKNYLHAQNKASKSKLIKRSLHASNVTIT